MAATLTVENIFQQQDINVRKQLFNECLAHIISHEENDSEIETVARDSIAVTIEYILQWFNVDIDIETAVRDRDW